MAQQNDSTVLVEVRATAGGGVARNGTNFSAALGFNGAFARGPVGGAATPVNSYDATVFDLLSEPYAAHCSPHPKNTVCPEVFTAPLVT